MTQPKFSVGEEVILCSKNCPEFNGEYTVVASFYGETFSRQGKRYIGWNYDLDSTHVNYWWETALRKKHKPSDMSFDSLMNSIKSGDKVTDYETSNIVTGSTKLD